MATTEHLDALPNMRGHPTSPGERMSGWMRGGRLILLLAALCEVLGVHGLYRDWQDSLLRHAHERLLSMDLAYQASRSLAQMTWSAERRKAPQAMENPGGDFTSLSVSLDRFDATPPVIMPVSQEAHTRGAWLQFLPLLAVRDAMARRDPSREFVLLAPGEVFHGRAGESWGDAPGAIAGMLAEIALPGLNLIPASESGALIARLRALPEFRRSVNIGERAALTLSVAGSPWLVLLQPLDKLDGQSSGFLLSYGKDGYAASLREDFIARSALLTLILAILAYLIWRARDRVRPSLAEPARTQRDVSGPPPLAAVAADAAPHRVTRLASLADCQNDHADEDARWIADGRIRLAARVFDSTSEGAIITDTENRILYVNPAFTAISGFDQEDVVGKPARVLGAPHLNASPFLDMRASLERDGHWRGEFFNRHRNGSVYPVDMSISVVRDEAGHAAHFVGIFRNISAQKKASAELERRSLHDSLTGLPNRALLQRRLEQAREDLFELGVGMALLSLELAQFDQVRDSLGHEAGDQLLRQVAARLHGAVRDGDTVARVGDSEFMLLLRVIALPSQAEDIALAILDHLAHPFHVGAQSLSLAASIGVSLYPSHGDEVETLISNANQARFQSRSRGRHGYCLFQPDRAARATERHEIGRDLRGAAERGELRVLYQPQYHTLTGHCLGVEALARWEHPVRGTIQPDVFIPIAEDLGLIGEIGTWVLGEACRQMALWLGSGIALPRVAVNVSIQQLEQGDLPAQVAEMLRSTGLEARRLELEITESMTMSQTERIVGVMRALRDMGVQLAVDDFGTGYSSLAYLKHLPLDRLKIDKSFVRDITSDSSDRTIARSIISLGHSLGMEILAEGVENEAQAALLLQESCDALQGFLFDPPLPAEELTRRWHTGDGGGPAPLLYRAVAA